MFRPLGSTSLCAALGCILAATAGCGDSASTATPSASPPAPVATATTTGTSTSTAALRAPKPKAYGDTAEPELGTLPPGVGIAVGQPAPDFELPGLDGKRVRLSSLIERSEVLLVFYRGGW